MPNPLKKAKFTRFVTSLRSKRGDSLVVQTGFPTSLADLFVKNQSRLRKPSSKKKPSSTSPDVESASFRVSQIVLATAAAVRLPSDGSDSRFESEAREEIKLSPVAENPRNEEIIEEIHSPRVQTQTFSRDENSETKKRRGFRTLAVLFLVMILAIGTKKMAFGITVLAFALLLLESLGKYVPSFFLRPGLGLKQSDGSDSNSLVEDRIGEFGFCSIGLNGNSEIRLLNKPSEGSKERENQDEFRTSARKQNNGNLKGNKLLRKFVLKKYLAGKYGRVPNKKEDEGGKSAGGDEDDDDDNDDLGENNPNSKTSNEDLGADMVELGFVRAIAGLMRKGSTGHLVFFAVVLIGLVGGRVVALFLTVMWCFLMKSNGSKQRKWNDH